MFFLDFFGIGFKFLFWMMSLVLNYELEYWGEGYCRFRL